MVNRFGNALALAALSVGFSTASRAVDIVGSNQVTLGWSAASGPVSGYYVIVSRNAAPTQVEGVTIQPQRTVSGAYGDSIVVQVAAFGADGVAGPVSAPSEPINFVPSGSGGGGTTTPPPGGGDGGDPPPSSPPPDSPGPVARDFNGDGTADLVVRTGSDLRIWVMQRGAVASEISLPLAPAGSRVVGTGDYDGNGNADLLWENTSTSALMLWLLDGGVVTSMGSLDRSSLPAAEEWRVGGSGDFDGDGADDVMLWSRVRGEVELWTFSGTAVASRTRIAGHKGAWSVVAVDDTDGDGMAEIVWLDELHRALELRDPAASAPVALGNLASGWRGRGAVDLAGDGSAELVMHHAQLGSTQAWALDDGGVIGSSDLPSAKNLGVFAGGGDYDTDGGEDATWSDAGDRAVTLWLGAGSAPTALVVNRALPSGGEVVSGATGSDDTAFRTRFCSGDIDQNGMVNSSDFRRLQQCLNQPRTGICSLADMDSDGAVTSADYDVFKLRFTGQLCEAW